MFGWLRKQLAPKSLSTTIKREFNTDIVGIEHVPDAVEHLRKLRVGDKLRLVREPEDPHDRNTIAIFDSDGHKLGYISARIASDVTRALEEDSGKLSHATIIEKTALGRDHKRFNAVIRFHLSRLRRDHHRPR